MLTHMTRFPPALRLPFSTPHVRAPYPLLLVLGSIFLLTVFFPNLQARVLGQFGESNSLGAAAP
jgi:hypothetical protein